MDSLRKLAEQLQKGSGGNADESAQPKGADNDDDDVPELIPGETFEAAAEEGHAAATI